MKKSSDNLQSNIFFNVLKTGISVIAPLITYTYITRRLGIENIGKVNFVTSLISYFQLIASLGINNYAISLGAKIRDDKKKFNIFSSEIFSINMISTLIAYVMLFLMLFFVKPISQYRTLLIISSISMFFVCIGMEWVYGAFENYKYISIRSIVFQILNVFLIIIFINNPSDIYLYTFLTVLPTIGSGLINYFYRKNFMKFDFSDVHYKNVKKHFKPIFLIWGMSVASVIYINSDTIMLTLINGNRASGLYSVATKTSHVICLMLSAVCTVLLPKLSKIYNENNKEKFSETLEKTFCYLLMIIFPLFIGLFMLSKEAVLLLGGETYILSVNAAKIISINVIFSPINGLIASQVFIPMGMQKISFISTVVGAITNVALNFILLPKYGIEGAAVTTIIAELVVFVFGFVYIRKIINTKNILKSIIQYIIASVAVILVCYFWKLFINNIIFRVVFDVICSCLFYFVILIILKNESFMEMISRYIKK
ncbi:MAG: flippase [Lachnospira sp.]|nr:flippase [Lachnospira sp.]